VLAIEDFRSLRLMDYIALSALCFSLEQRRKKLFGLLAPWFDFLSPDLEILYDKGLRNGSHLLPNLSKIHNTPSFLGTEWKQYGDKELSKNRKIARLRYTIEVGYSRIENWQLIKCYGLLKQYSPPEMRNLYSH